MHGRSLTREVFESCPHFDDRTQFEEHADTLLRQIRLALTQKPVCRFVIPSLDHEARKEVLALLPVINGVAMIGYGSILYDDAHFHFTRIELRR